MSSDSENINSQNLDVDLTRTNHSNINFHDIKAGDFLLVKLLYDSRSSKAVGKYFIGKALEKKDSSVHCFFSTQEH